MTPESTECPRGVQNAERIRSLEARMTVVEHGINEIRDKLLGRLPNWATLLLTILSMLVAGLLVSLSGR